MKILLETQHLVLRTFTEDDTAMLLDLCQDEKVMAFTGQRPFTTIEEADNLLHHEIFQNQYESNGYGFWAVHLLKNGLFIGWCGLKKVGDDVFLDCRLRKRFWDKGYGSEISTAILDYAFKELKLSEVLAKTHEKNLNAIRVMEKIGLQFRKTKKVKRQRFVTYGLSYEEWKHTESSLSTDVSE